jgi:hypothetical protein
MRGKVPGGRRTSLFLAAILIAAGCGGDGRKAPQQPPPVADRVLATYANGALTEREALDQMAGMSRRQRRYLSRSLERKRWFVENLVLDELLFEDGKQLGLDDEEIAKRVAAYHRRLVVERVREKYAKPPELSDEDLLRHYQEHPALYSGTTVKASHIRVADEKTAREILAEVKAHPEKFAAIARQRSIDRETAAKGGEIGTIVPGRLPLAYETVVFELKPGEIADDVVRTRHGYHVIMVTEREERRPRPFLLMKEIIRARLRNEVVTEGLHERLAHYKQQFNLRFDDDAIARLNPMRGAPPPHRPGH